MISVIILVLAVVTLETACIVSMSCSHMTGTGSGNIRSTIITACILGMSCSRSTCSDESNIRSRITTLCIFDIVGVTTPALALITFEVIFEVSIANWFFNSSMAFQTFFISYCACGFYPECSVEYS